MHGFPCKKVHGNKNGDLFALKTFKIGFNIDVHLNLSNIWKTKTNIFFKKKEKEVVPKWILSVYNMLEKVYCTAKHNAKSVIE